MAFVDDFLTRVDEISAKVKANALIEDTRAAMQAFLKDYAVTDEKKGEIYASFEATIAANMIKTVFDTALQIPNIEKEIEVKTSQAGLLDAQKDNEVLRGYDIKAGVNVKNMQTIAAWESALYEAMRRKVLLRSDANNTKINKAKEANNFLQAMATRVDPSSDDISYVKGRIDGIDTSEVADSSTTEVGAKPTLITIP